jgi:hypothetical protein
MIPTEARTRKLFYVGRLATRCTTRHHLGPMVPAKPEIQGWFGFAYVDCTHCWSTLTVGMPGVPGAVAA